MIKIYCVSTSDRNWNKNRNESFLTFFLCQFWLFDGLDTRYIVFWLRYRFSNQIISFRTTQFLSFYIPGTFLFLPTFFSPPFLLSPCTFERSMLLWELYTSAPFHSPRSHSLNAHLTNSKRITIGFCLHSVHKKYCIL